MNRLLEGVAPAVLILSVVAIQVDTAHSAVITDTPFTSTTQIQSAANNTLFGSFQNLAALNLHYGSYPAGGTLNGIGFHDVAITPFSANNWANGVTSPTFAPGVTVDYNFSRDGDNRPLTSSVITGPDAAVATNIVHDNRYFGLVPTNSDHTMTFHGLGANQSVYVQLLGGQHGWNKNTTVYANNVPQGTWQSNKTSATTGLYGFRARANAAGDLSVELRTDQYGGMAAAIVSATDPLPNLPVMSGLNYWLDASNIDARGNVTLTNGAAVNRWADLATGNDAIVRPAPSTDTSPVFVANAINGRPAVQFDNLLDRLTSPATSTWGTVFVVNSIDPGNVDITGMLGFTSGDVGIRWHTAADPRWRGNPGYTNSGDLTGYPSGQGRISINGKSTDQVAYNTFHVLSAVPPNPIANAPGPQLGGFNSSGGGAAYGREFLGKIAEVVIFDRTLNPTETLRMSKYLADKYALPLAPVDAPLTNTNQVVLEPFGLGNSQHVAVNFRYSTPEVTGTFNGLRFDNVSLTVATDPKGPFALSANGVTASLLVSIPGSDNTPRTQNPAASITGADEATLEAVLSEMFYVSATNHTPSVLTFSGLKASELTYVQLLGGDAGAGWNGDMLVQANGQTIGTWTNVSDGNAATASLFGFFAMTDPLGRLELNLTIAAGNHGALAGVLLTQLVPEPSTLALLAAGALGLLVVGRRRRR